MHSNKMSYVDMTTASDWLSFLILIGFSKFFQPANIIIFLLYLYFVIKYLGLLLLLFLHYLSTVQLRFDLLRALSHR